MPRLDEKPDEQEPSSRPSLPEPVLSGSKTAKARGKRSGKKTGQAAGLGLLRGAQPLLAFGVSDGALFLRDKTIRRAMKSCCYHPILWLSPAPTLHPDWMELLQTSTTAISQKDKSSKRWHKWLDKLAVQAREARLNELSQQNPDDAFEMLAATWLAGLAGPVSASAESGTAADDWRQIMLDAIWRSADGFDELPHDDLLIWMWTQVESPAVLAASMADDHPTSMELRRRTLQRLEEWFEFSVDPEGVLPGRHAGVSAQVTLSAVRTARLLKLMGCAVSERVATQLEWMIRQLMLMIGGKRGLLFSELRLESDPGLTDLLLKSSDDATDHYMIRHQLGASGKRRRLPTACHYSESQGLGVLRTGWKKSAGCLGIACDGPEMRLDLRRGVPLLQGPVNGKWSLNGRETNWENSTWGLNCWYEDAEIQYLELELKNEEGLKAQRHLILLPEDRLFLFADVLLGAAPARIDYRLDLPAAKGMDLQQETDTREVYLRSKKIEGLVLPVSIGEWQRDHTVNAFSVMDDSLQLDQSLMGQNMMAALIVDFDARRAQRPRTWRTLSVGEALESLPRDTATAFRFQIGREQWVFYRSLSRPGNRTFLGNNVCCDFYLGRFRPNGTHEILVMIEA